MEEEIEVPSDLVDREVASSEREPGSAARPRLGTLLTLFLLVAVCCLSFYSRLMSLKQTLLWFYLPKRVWEDYIWLFIILCSMKSYRVPQGHCLEHVMNSSHRFFCAHLYEVYTIFCVVSYKITFLVNPHAMLPVLCIRHCFKCLILSTLRYMLLLSPFCRRRNWNRR